MMAIGAETSGWAIQLDSERTIGGKPFKSIEIVYPNSSKLEVLKDKRVRATGRLDTRSGVETGERTVLNLTSLRELKSSPGSASSSSLNLVGSQWRLIDLAGTPALDKVPATLLFPETGKVAGRASCNRFTGAVEISGNDVKFGPLVSTRMACPEPTMTQETKYLAALQDAERYEWKSPNLLIYSKGVEKPLKFTRILVAQPAK